MTSPQSSSALPSTPFSLPTYHVKQYVTVNLDYTNYLTWKTQLENFLIFNNLLGYVDGCISKPVKPTSNTDSTSTQSASTLSLNDWLRYDRFVTACITATLSDTLVHQATGHDSAHELWTTLNENFMQQSLARKTLLRAQLGSLKKDHLSVAAYLNHINSLSMALTAIGDPLSDSDMVLVTLNGLPKDYSPFVTSIENLPTPPTFSQLRAKLLTFEQRILLDDGTTSALAVHVQPSSTIPDALLASHKSSSSHSSPSSSSFQSNRPSSKQKRKIWF